MMLTHMASTSPSRHIHRLDSSRVASSCCFGHGSAGRRCKPPSASRPRSGSPSFGCPYSSCFGYLFSRFSPCECDSLQMTQPAETPTSTPAHHRRWWLIERASGAINVFRTVAGLALGVYFWEHWAQSPRLLVRAGLLDATLPSAGWHDVW